MFQSSLFNFNREYSSRRNQVQTKPQQQQEYQVTPIDFSIPCTLLDDHQPEKESNSHFWSSNRKFGLSNNAFSHLNNTLHYTISNMQSSSSSSTMNSATIPMHAIQEGVESSLPKHYSIDVELDHEQHHIQQHQEHSNRKFVSQEEFFQQVYARYQSDSDSVSNNSYNSSNNSNDSNNLDGQEVATSIFSSFSFWG